MDSSRADTHLEPTPVPPVDPGGFAPGTILGERYRIVAMLGRGGMGEVYRADDLRLNQPVALKFLPAYLERDARARERLLAEVRNARSVSHPNVCRVYDVGEVSGRSFLTMEYIDGEDLASLLKRVGRLSPPKALEVARQLVAGLAAAHDKGLLHRDLKPANVMLDSQGRARLTDFGLSVEAAPGKSPGDFAGTVAYMAPERFEGKPATVRSDLYALGLVLYEACTGQAALRSTTVEGWRRAHSDSTPTPPSAVVAEIDRALERAILWCLEKDPAKRPASAAQLAAALPGGDPLAAMIAAGETPSPELVAVSGEEGTLPRGKAWTLFGAAVVTLIVAVVALASVSLHNLVPMKDPAALEDTARQFLQSLGYTGPVRATFWWTAVAPGYLDDLATRGTSRTRFALPARDVPGPMRFCYRQSPGSLFTLHLWTTFETWFYSEPAIHVPGEAYVELDTTGRLVALRVVPQRDAPAGGTAATDWSVLFRAARCDERQFRAAPLSSLPPDQSDVNVAWTGTCDAQPVRMEAAALGGRVSWFEMESARAGGTPSEPGTRGWRFVSAFRVALLVLVLPVILLGVLAWRNYAAGRGDRRGALRLAAVVFAIGCLSAASRVRWSFEVTTLVAGAWIALGYAAFPAFLVWALYLGCEPPVRRRWPHLLVSWTRLLDGRWRDPLVGRALLIGLLTGSAWAALPGVIPALGRRWLDWRGARPTYSPFVLNGSIFWAGLPVDMIVTVFWLSLAFIGVLGAARLLLRSNAGAWALFVLVLLLFFGAVAGGGVFPRMPIVLLAGVSIAITALALAAFVRAGLLGLAAAWLVPREILFGAPWTLDPSRWFFWRGAVVFVVLLAIAFWGFRNALGKQSMFPAEKE